LVPGRPAFSRDRLATDPFVTTFLKARTLSCDKKDIIICVALSAIEAGTGFLLRQDNVGQPEEWDALGCCKLYNHLSTNVLWIGLILEADANARWKILSNSFKDANIQSTSPSIDMDFIGAMHELSVQTHLNMAAQLTKNLHFRL
jgi:hypothetical protein